MKRISLACFVMLGYQLAAAAADVSEATSPKSDPLVQLERAKERVADAEKYLLRYQAQTGEKIHYRSEHLTTVDTLMQGVSQTSRSRSESLKAWEIGAPPSANQLHFVHRIEGVDMWSTVDNQPPLCYNSRTDEKAPENFAGVAQVIGKPLSEITINHLGHVQKRRDHFPIADLGIGGITVPFPESEIVIGQRWHVPNEAVVKSRSGRHVKVKLRHIYELKDVQTGVATIRLETQVMTPITDATLQSQLVQKLIRGEIRFDIDEGHILSKEFEWHETVIGFRGPDSNMKYMARFSETLVEKQRLASH